MFPSFSIMNILMNTHYNEHSNKKKQSKKLYFEKCRVDYDYQSSIMLKNSGRKNCSVRNSGGLGRERKATPGVRAGAGRLPVALAASAGEHALRPAQALTHSSDII